MSITHTSKLTTFPAVMLNEQRILNNGTIKVIEMVDEG